MNRRALAWTEVLVLLASKATMLYLVLSAFSEPLAMWGTFLYGVGSGWRMGILFRDKRASYRWSRELP